MNPWRFMLGLCLTAAAGAIDAVSFLRFGAVYASFMSGNTVQLGLHVATADLHPLGGFMALVGLFMLGGFVGSMLLATTGRWSLPAILAVELAAVCGAVLLDARHAPVLAATALLSLAMGAQNNLVMLVRGANPGTTFVTGTAFRFSDALAQRMLGRDPAGAWRLHLTVWLAFAAGAALGAGAQTFLGDLALVPVAGTVAALTVAALVVRFAERMPASS